MVCGDSSGRAGVLPKGGLMRHTPPQHRAPCQQPCIGTCPSHSLAALLSITRTQAPPPPRSLSTGPTGKVLLLPEDPNAVIICVATGTGIAPFRTFWRRMFMENVPNYKFTGGWGGHGLCTRSGLLGVVGVAGGGACRLGTCWEWLDGWLGVC